MFDQNVVLVLMEPALARGDCTVGRFEAKMDLEDLGLNRIHLFN